MLATVTNFLPLTAIRRERVLPVSGKVLARKGQKVNATDTVAEVNLSPQHLILDLARGLGVPPNQVDRHLQCRSGDQVAEGDIVAGPVGITRRVVRSPARGRVVLAGSGQILLEVLSQPFELKAGLPGVVSDLIADRGVIIETTGALLQGVWGNGKIDYGLLTVLISTPEQVLSIDRLDVSQRGAIILAGYCEDPEVLKVAAEMPLRGLILSSMSPALIPAAQKISLPVVVIEGFGQRPLNTIAFKLLSSSERREIAINAEPWDRYAGTRPEIIIALPASGNLSQPKEMGYFAEDQQVRIVREPFASKNGVLIELMGTMILPSGVRAPAAKIRLENGEQVVLPLANLEVIE